VRGGGAGDGLARVDARSTKATGGGCRGRVARPKRKRVEAKGPARGGQLREALAARTSFLFSVEPVLDPFEHLDALVQVIQRLP